MYEFYYKYLKAKYNTSLRLLATDTDSFITEVITSDFYMDILEDVHLFDTSNFPKNHFLYSKTNEHKTGIMKFEFVKMMIIELSLIIIKRVYFSISYIILLI